VRGQILQCLVGGGAVEFPTVAANRELDQKRCAHVLRRTSFGPFPGQIEEALQRHTSVGSLVEEQLERSTPFEPRIVWQDFVDGELRLVDAGPVGIEGPEPDLSHYHVFRAWWVRRMMQDEAALHDKMMWIWHGIFATSSEKTGSANPNWQQMRTLHLHALGNFRDLATAITTSAAMIVFLDGNNSNVTVAVNENHGRELMELHMLGLDHFDQADVVAASRALAGWEVTNDNEVLFHPERALTEGGTLLGVDGVKDVDDVVDAILRHPGCAPYVVSRLWDSLIGTSRDGEVIERWASEFRRSGYEIAPLIRTMCLSDQFLESANARARTPIEWYCGVVRAAGDDDRLDYIGHLIELGQAPYMPPNVSGWPGSNAWMTATQARARLRVLSTLKFTAASEVGGSADPVEAVIERCSLHGAGEATTTALRTLQERLVNEGADPTLTGSALMSAVFMSPEYALA
jgi:uncharacterized protein (DUF1800 family)